MDYNEHNPTRGVKISKGVPVYADELIEMSDKHWPKGEFSKREQALREALDIPGRVRIAAKGYDIRGYIHHSIDKENDIVQIENFIGEPELKKMLFDDFCNNSNEVKQGMTIRINQVSSALGELGFEEGTGGVMTTRRPYTAQHASYNTTQRLDIIKSDGHDMTTSALSRQFATSAKPTGSGHFKNNK
jgi:hypothetical protein